MSTYTVDTMADAEEDDLFEEIPPCYIIDQSLQPAQRYVEVAEEFKLVLQGLPVLFDELLEIANLPRRTIHFIAHLVFRRLHSSEQTEELRGISKVIGVPMYLLVAYNVLLDLFMGCTSGGVMVKEKDEKQKRMMHFRTLDWGMPALRKAVCQFEYRQGKDGPIIAKAISYVGFVGILTAVRDNLSVSLNFRPYHNNDASIPANVKYRLHQALVLLGIRPSIAAQLRTLILPAKDPTSKSPKLADIAKDFPHIPSTAAYLTFCDGTQTLVLEKDRLTAKLLASHSFIAVTNHDVSYEKSDQAQEAHTAHAKANTQSGLGMEELVEESIERKNCLANKWQKRTRRFGEKARMNNGVYVSAKELKEWLDEYPVTNGETHFVAVMDPKKGDFAWVRWFPEEGSEYESGSDSGASSA